MNIQKSVVSSLPNNNQLERHTEEKISFTMQYTVRKRERGEEERESPEINLNKNFRAYINKKK